MRKTWIGLCLAGLLCLPLAGCAGNKTGGDITPGTTANPTTQTTPTAAPHPTDEVLGGDVDSGAPVGGDSSRIGTSNATGNANDSALERMGEGVKDTLDDLGNGARSMAQDAKRAME